MIEHLKTKIWDLLKQKEVSLAMILSRSGEIFWHRGRCANVFFLIVNFAIVPQKPFAAVERKKAKAFDTIERSC